MFNAQRSMIAIQAALNTISHNINNGQTEGYSRQRVDLAAADPYTVPSLNDPNGGQIGQGAVVEQVTRSRDAYLDSQYRTANGTYNMDQSILSSLQQIEGILNEPSDSGISAGIENFFDAAQEMSLHPEETSVLTSFTQSAIDLVTIFQQEGQQLLAARQNLVGDPANPGTVASSQLSVMADQVNNLLTGIAHVNQSILSVQSSGAQANDLKDQRDKLLDQLSKLTDMQVSELGNGQVNVTIAGQLMVQNGQVKDTLQVTANPGPAPTATSVPALISTVNGGVVLNDGAGAEITSGTIKGVSDMGSDNPQLSAVQTTLNKLDTLLNAMANQVNALQTTGRDQYGNLGNALFVLNPALNPTQPQNLFHWTINTAVQSDPKLLATASDDPSAPGNYAGIGDARNALAMAKLRDQTFAALGNTGFTDYYNSIVSKLGIDTQSYKNATASQNNLVQSLDQQRQAVSGVNLDDEMVDLLRYQRGFESTSKIISTFNDVYKTIIGMV